MTLKLFDEPDYVPSLGQYHTPPKLAAKVAEEFRSYFVGATVVEPAAGGGSLVRAALDVGAGHVVAVEVDPAWCRALERRFESEIREGRVSVLCEDFLSLDPRDRRLAPRRELRHTATLSNPPYNDGLDTRFLAALVDFSETVARDILWPVPNVGIFNTSALAGVERYEVCWSRTTLIRQINLVRRPPFGAEEGNRGGSKEVSVLAFGGNPEPVPFAWWPDSWT